MAQPRFFYLLQKAHSALFRAADSALRQQYGIGAAQQAILFSLSRDDRAPISKLAAQLMMGKSSLTGLIDRMEKANLLRRVASDQDARSVHIVLSEQGRKLVNQSLPATKRINASLLEPFSANDQTVIERFLKHVADNASAIVNEKTLQSYNTGHHTHD